MSTCRKCKHLEEEEWRCGKDTCIICRCVRRLTVIPSENVDKIYKRPKNCTLYRKGVTE